MGSATEQKWWAWELTLQASHLLCPWGFTNFRTTNIGTSQTQWRYFNWFIQKFRWIKYSFHHLSGRSSEYMNKEDVAWKQGYSKWLVVIFLQFLASLVILHAWCTRWMGWSFCAFQDLTSVPVSGALTSDHFCRCGPHWLDCGQSTLHSALAEPKATLWGAELRWHMSELRPAQMFLSL